MLRLLSCNYRKFGILSFVFPSSAFEVNFMDDVGQTLLNWASAFGTQEMVSTQHNDFDLCKGKCTN